MSVAVINGALVAAHRTALDQLRITWQLADGWQSESLMGLAENAGRSLTALPGFDGTVQVVHGATSPPNTSDAGLLLTTGRLGMFETRLIADDEVGGSNGVALVGDAITIITRLFRRSPIFGNADGLRYYSNAGVIDFYDSIEAHGSIEQRHRYRSLDMTTDRFGLPVFVALDESLRFGDERGTAFTCVWRPRDSDADGIPDDAEGRYGTDINDPDSDGDGRLDGDEVLLQGTDPLVMDPLPPDMGVPDLGVADFGIDPLDAGIDAALDAGADAAPDSGVDAAGDAMPDGGSTIDAGPDGADARPPADAGDTEDAAPDAREPDAQPDDMARADSRINEPSDAAAPDADTPDTPDAGGMSGTGGGSDGCRAVPGRDPGGLALLGLLIFGLRRRK